MRETSARVAARRKRKIEEETTKPVDNKSKTLATGHSPSSSDTDNINQDDIEHDEWNIKQILSSGYALIADEDGQNEIRKYLKYIGYM